MVDAKKPSKVPKAKGSGSGGRVELELTWGDALRPALISGVPAILLAAWCLCDWHQGPGLRRPFTVGDATQLALIAGGITMISGVGGVLLPVAKLFFHYPAERFSSGSKLAWGLPLLAAIPIWISIYVLSVGGLLLGGAAIIHGLVSLGLLDRWHALVG